LGSDIFTLLDSGLQGLFVPANGLFAVALIKAALIVPVLLANGFGEGIGILPWNATHLGRL